MTIDYQAIIFGDFNAKCSKYYPLEQIMQLEKIYRFTQEL